MMWLYQICRVGVRQYHFPIIKVCFVLIFHGNQYTFDYEFKDPNHSCLIRSSHRYWPTLNISNLLIQLRYPLQELAPCSSAEIPWNDLHSSIYYLYFPSTNNHNNETNRKRKENECKYTFFTNNQEFKQSPQISLIC